MTWVPSVLLPRAVVSRRRLLAALLAGLAVLCALAALRPPGAPTELVLTAAHDLDAGRALTLADLRAVALPAAAVPAGALRPGAAVLGRLVAGPVRAGEPLTDVRLVGPALLGRLAPGSVALPVRFADAGAAALLRPGDRIDVLATTDRLDGADTVLALPPGPAPPAEPGQAPPAAPGQAAHDAPAPPAPSPGARDSPATVVAADVVVLAVPDTGTPAGLDGALVVLACRPAIARALAAAAAHGRLSPALRPPEGAP